MKLPIRFKVKGNTKILNACFSFQASRANFQHGQLKNTNEQNKAMDSIKEEMEQIVFEGEEFTSPIPYTFLYVQWEANKVRRDDKTYKIKEGKNWVGIRAVNLYFFQLIVGELIRNLSLTFTCVMLGN